MKDTKIKGGVFFRSCDIEPVVRQEKGKNNREFKGILTSETPVERWFGWEVLSHEKGAINLKRFKSGAPVLLNHDQINPDNHVGTVTGARLRDGVLEWDFRLASDGVTEQADRAARKIEDGILTKASAGYIPNEMEETKRTIQDKPVFLVTKWTPVEGSLVPIPADNTAALRTEDADDYQIIVRGLEMTEMIEDTNVDVTPEAREPDIVATQPREPKRREEKKIDLRAELAKADKANRERILNIQAIASRHQDNEEIQKLATEAISGGAEFTLERFQGQFIDLVKPDDGGVKSLRNDVASFLDLSMQESDRYSLSRCADATFTRDWSKAGFELECSDAIAEKLDREPRGAYIPIEVFVRNSQRMQMERYNNMVAMGITDRAPPMTTTTGGVGLVGTMHLGSAFIDALRPFTVTIQAGAQVLADLPPQKIQIPKLSSSAAFEWLTEDEDATDVEAVTVVVPMEPKTIASAVPYTRRTQTLSVPSIDAVLLNDLTLGAAIGIDKGAIQGTGANGEPLGILNQTGVQTVAVGTPGSAPTEGQPTWENIVEFETKLSQANADGFANSYMSAIDVRGHGKTTLKSTGVSGYIWENNQMNGYPAVATNQMPQYKTLYGDFNQCLIGFWGVLDILMDWATKAKSGGMVMRVFQDADVAVRHGVAFVKSELATP